MLKTLALALALTPIGTGPAGGTVWQHVIPNPALPPFESRPTVVYLPPGFTRSRRYPVVYLLHGFPGSPYQFVSSLRLAEAADMGIAEGSLPPFVAVVPPAGFDVHHGDWTGVWETYLVDTVLPWADANLPVSSYRAVAGLSEGGYGALAIALRHPGLFAAAEAWSGYFDPLEEGSLRHLPPAELAAYDPRLLVRREAPFLRRTGLRIFLSAGTTHDRVTARATRSFAGELRGLGLPFRLWLAPGGHNGRFWRAQLAPALRYALTGHAL